jgi:hypothetical protein
MMASVRTSGSRPNLVRELAYTLLLSTIAVVSMGWMGTPDRQAGTHPQVSIVLPY